LAKYKEDYDSKLDFGTELDFFDDDSPEPAEVEPFDDMFTDIDAEDPLFEDELDMDDFDDDMGLEEDDVEDEYDLVNMVSNDTHAGTGMETPGRRWHERPRTPHQGQYPTGRLDCQEIYVPGCAVPRPDPGRQPGADEGR
jgi:hypothetical protein